jgi:hypothetical protein
MTCKPNAEEPLAEAASVAPHAFIFAAVTAFECRNINLHSVVAQKLKEVLDRDFQPRVLRV